MGMTQRERRRDFGLFLEWFAVLAVFTASFVCSADAVASCAWKTSDIIDHRIWVDSTQSNAQQSLMRMMSAGGEERLAASAMIGAIKSGKLERIWLKATGPVADRAKSMGLNGFWDIKLKKPHYSVCLTEPPGELPMIVYSDEVVKGKKRSPADIDEALMAAWRECGLPTPEPPCTYAVDRHKPPPPRPAETPPTTANLTVVVTAEGAPVDDVEVGVSESDTGYGESRQTSGGKATFDTPSGTIGIYANPSSTEYETAFATHEVS